MSYDVKIPNEEQIQRTYNNASESRRVNIVDATSGISPTIKTNPNTLNNELLVNLEGHQCPGNTTLIPLGANETFTGSTWQDTLDYGTLSIAVGSDVDSTTNGLKVQWSYDGINPINSPDDYTIYANLSKTLTFGPAARYYRVVYTNGPVAQTEFHLISLLRRNYVKPSSHKINDNIVGEDDAELVKSVITGLDDTGIFRNGKVDINGRQQVVAQPYLYSVAEGTIPYHFPLLKFGTRTSVAAATESLVWEGPTAVYPYITTAQQLKVSSSSANDTLLGTGIRTLTLIGLDANYDEISETIDMAGLTVVTTTLSYLRIFRAFGVTSGTSHTNLGTITVTNNAGTSVQLVINAGDGQTLMTKWTVPRGKSFYLTGGSVSSDTTKGARASFFTRQLDGGILYPWQIKYRAYIAGSNENFSFTIPFKIPEKTDIEVRVITPASAGTTSAGATFGGWYEDI